MISVLVAPLFYLIPAGFALSLLGGLIGRTPSALLLSSACSAGLVVLTILLQIAERLVLLQQHFLLICYLILIVAAFGLARLHQMRPKQELTTCAAITTLAVVMIYYLYNYFVLSPFPTGDLFQDVHTMKGAEELGRFGVLSPFVTDSYIPIKQAISGILIRTFGFDQLVGFWALGVWTIAFKLIATFAASSVVTVHRYRMLTFIITSALIVNAEFSNGILCFFSSLLLMAAVNIWVRRRSVPQEDATPTSTTIALLLLVGAVLVYAKMSYVSDFTYGLIFVALISNFRFLRIFIEASPPQLSLRLQSEPIGILVVLLVGSMFLMHRSSIILIPIAVFTGWVLAAQPPKWSQFALKVLGIALPIVSLVPLALVIAEYLKLVDLTRVYGLMLSSFAVILHSNAEDDFGLGVGLRNALIEWSRSIGLLFAILLAATFYYTAVTHKGRALWNNAQFSLSWIGGWGLTLIILTGTPFGYRASFYASFLFAVAASIAFSSLWRSTGKPVKAALAVILAVATAFLLIAYFAKIYAGYLGFIWPIGVIAAAAGLLLVSYPLISRRFSPPIILAVVIALALSLDRVGSKFMLLPHSYGEPPNRLVAISHYTEDDLEIAESLRALGPTTVVLSDPYTMSIVRARTGLNAIVGYSNLDTINDKERMILRDAINAAESGNKNAYCAAVNQLIDAGAGEYWYSIRRLVHFANDSDKPRQTDTAFVFSAKTAEWASIPIDQRVSYFPNQAHLNENQLSAVMSVGSIISRKGDMIIATSISCPAELSNLSGD